MYPSAPTDRARDSQALGPHHHQADDRGGGPGHQQEAPVVEEGPVTADGVEGPQHGQGAGDSETGTSQSGWDRRRVRDAPPVRDLSCRIPRLPLRAGGPTDLVPGPPGP